MNKVHLKVSAKQISLMTHFWPLFANANGTAKWSKNEKNHFMASRRIIKICNLSKSGVYSYRQQCDIANSWQQSFWQARGLFISIVFFHNFESEISRYGLAAEYFG